MNWLRVRRGVDVVKIALPEPATYQGLIDAYASALDSNPRVRMISAHSPRSSHGAGIACSRDRCDGTLARRGRDRRFGLCLGADRFQPRRPRDRLCRPESAQVDPGRRLAWGRCSFRRTRIGDVDPFMANDELPADDIRARVHSPPPPPRERRTSRPSWLCLMRSIFTQRIGVPAKAARLRYLRDLWAERAARPKRDGNFDACRSAASRGSSSFRLVGRTSRRITCCCQGLLDEHRIFYGSSCWSCAGACVRVTPGLFNSPAEM